MPLPKEQYMPESSKLDMQRRQATLLREGGKGLFKEAAKEMYDNPVVNTAISLTPGIGDAQAGFEAIASAREGDWAGAGLNALGVLPFLPALGGMVKNAGKADDIVDASYRGAHTAPTREFGAPLHDLTGGGQFYPDDIYSPNAARFYGHGGDQVALDRETARIVQALRNKPDAMVDIYRAVPDSGDIAAINAGDWVTVNPNYAKRHGESALEGKYKILSSKVPAKHVYTNADSIHEFGYDPDVLEAAVRNSK